MMLFAKPPYMVASAIPPLMPRQCRRPSGEPKSTYATRTRAKRVIRILRVRALHTYVCSEQHIHIGHRR